MQIMFEQLNILGENSIRIKWDDFPHFTFPWHYHPEFEIVCVLKSYGQRFVGDSVVKFKAGDLVLVGSNLPHFWQNAPAFHEANSQLRVNAIVVQFSPDLFQAQTLQLPEFSAIAGLLERASRGIQFIHNTKSGLINRLKRMLQLSGIMRYSELLLLLNEMAHHTHSKLLASAHFEINEKTYFDQRINKILSYMNYHYTQKITLDTLASVAGMNKTALCRFFRQKTGKTVVQHINELRIGFACKLLSEKKLQIADVAIECGFNSLSHFNSTFMRVTGHTPSRFKTISKSRLKCIMNNLL